MSATEFYDDRLFLTFGQIYLISGSSLGPDFDGSRRGQANGICGAAEPGMLLLATGLHTGWVGLRVEYFDVEPELGETWEEVVEVSFTPNEPEIRLHGLDGDGTRFWLPVQDYRVRYCAIGMDEARKADSCPEDEPAIDRYLLQFWPAAPAPDRILRQTSEIAAYWHQAWR